MTQVEVNSIKLAISLFQADRQLQLDEAASAPSYSCQMSLSPMTAAAVSAWTLYSWDAAAAALSPFPFQTIHSAKLLLFAHFVFELNSYFLIFASTKLDIYTDEVKASPEFPFNFYRICLCGNLLF